MLSQPAIERMRAEAVVKLGTAVLPSLTATCRKRGLPAGGSATQMKKRLREDRTAEILRCPVCLDAPCIEDVIVVCAEGHHMCFGCLAQLRKPSCPICVSPLRPSPPGQLLRQLLENVSKIIVFQTFC